MKKLFAAGIICLLWCAFVRADASEIGRYQIISIAMPGQVPRVITLDTITGDTWKLEFNNLMHEGTRAKSDLWVPIYRLSKEEQDAALYKNQSKGSNP